MTTSIANMNLGQARVVDPILSSHVQGYRNAELVGYSLFPRVPVPANSGKVIEFGKEHFLELNLDRAPGGPTKRISYGYAGKDYKLKQDSVEAVVPREHLREAAAVPGLDLARGAVDITMRAVSLSLERRQASLATTAANYDNDHKLTLAGATKWSAGTGVPLNDFDTAITRIQQDCGVRPNTALFSVPAWTAFRRNPQVRGYFPNSDGPITVEMAKRVLEIERIEIGRAVSTPRVDVPTSFVWGNNAILAYVANPSGTDLPSMGNPSFGYTYQLADTPYVEAPYWDANNKCWVYGVTSEAQPVLSGILSGYLFVNPN